MPVNLEIRENGRVLYWVFSDPWTVKEVTEHVEENLMYRDGSSEPIHTIMNMSAGGHLPKGALSLRQVSPDLNHQTSGHFVLIGTNAFVRNLAEVVFKVARSQKFKFVATEQEAWTYIREVIRTEN